MKPNINDMTKGSELKHILKFMLPRLLGNLFQQLYTLVDSMMVGRFVSANALASVGAVGSISHLFMALCAGLAGGVNILTAQSYGSGNESRVKSVIGNGICVNAVAGGIMSLVSVCLAPMILHGMQVPQKNYGDALLYMRIVCGTMIITAVYNVISQVLCALGDAKTPLYFVIVSSVLNVILDLVFVAVFHWNVAGVAWATVIAQLVSAVGAALYAVKKNPYFKLEKEHFVFQKKVVVKMCSMGVPLAMQNAMGSLAGVVSQSVINGFGSTVMAAHAACSRVEQLMCQPYGTLGVAVANFSGQNMGAGKYDRIKNGCRKCVGLTLCYSTFVCVLFLFGGRQVIGTFVTDEEVIAVGAVGLTIVAVSHFFHGLVYIYKAMLNGAGDAVFTLTNSIIEVAARVVLIVALTSVPLLGYWGIWLTGVLVSVLSAGLCIRRYRSGKWMIKGLGEDAKGEKC